MRANRVYPDFANLTFIRHRVEQVQEYGQPYLSERELADLGYALEDLELKRDHSPRPRELIANLLNVAEDNLTREFAARVDRVTADLERNARIALANEDHEHYEWLIELLARLEHYRGGISIERGAWYWQHARYEADQTLDSAPELPAGIAERYGDLAITEPRETLGDFRFVRELRIVGSVLKRHRVYDALCRDHRWSPVTVLPTHARMAQITDLNTALSFLLGAASDAGGRRGKLVGSALINGVASPILITFDAHYRFFTVRAITSDPADAPFYQMVVGKNGRLEFLDAAPVSPSVADLRPELTHFAF